eukprot:1125401-Amphidinium_carterae.2
MGHAAKRDAHGCACHNTRGTPARRPAQNDLSPFAARVLAMCTPHPVQQLFSRNRTSQNQ